MGRMNCNNPHCPNDQLPQLRESWNEAEMDEAIEADEPYVIVIVHDVECLSNRSVGVAVIRHSAGHGGWYPADLNGDELEGTTVGMTMSEADNWATEVLCGDCGGNCGVLRQRVSKTMNSNYMD